MKEGIKGMGLVLDCIENKSIAQLGSYLDIPVR
jgi:hypothetical protein